MYRSPWVGIRKASDHYRAWSLWDVVPESAHSVKRIYGVQEKDTYISKPQAANPETKQDLSTDNHAQRFLLAYLRNRWTDYFESEGIQLVREFRI